MSENSIQKLEKFVNSELTSKIIDSSIAFNELIVTTSTEELLNVLKFLKFNEKCKFRQLIDIAGVDYPGDEKRFNLAIMKTYGMSNKRLLFLFTIQGVVLALIGSILGILLSFIVVLLQEKFHIISLSENIYFVSYLPMLFSVKNSLYILAISIISSIVFSSIALLQILSINPSKILKN